MQAFKLNRSNLRRQCADFLDSPTFNDFLSTTSYPDCVFENLHRWKGEDLSAVLATGGVCISYLPRMSLWHALPFKEISQGSLSELEAVFMVSNYHQRLCTLPNAARIQAAVDPQDRCRHAVLKFVFGSILETTGNGWDDIQDKMFAVMELASYFYRPFLEFINLQFEQGGTFTPFKLNRPYRVDEVMDRFALVAFGASFTDVAMASYQNDPGFGESDALPDSDDSAPDEISAANEKWGIHPDNSEQEEGEIGSDGDSDEEDTDVRPMKRRRIDQHAYPQRF